MTERSGGSDGTGKPGRTAATAESRLKPFPKRRQETSACSSTSTSSRSARGRTHYYRRFALLKSDEWETDNAVDLIVTRTCELLRLKNRAVAKTMDMASIRPDSPRPLAARSARSVEACAVIGRQPIFLGVGQLRRDHAHAAIHIVAALARSVVFELGDDVLRILFRQYRSFNRPSRSGTVTGGAWRHVAVRIAELDELHDVCRGIGQRRKIGITLRLRRIIGSHVGDRGIVETFSNIRHQFVTSAAGLVVVKLLVNGSSGLPGEMRKVGRHRYALLAVAGGADLQNLGAATFGLGIGQDLQDIGSPHHLRYGRRRGAVGRLLYRRRTRKNAKRAAYGRVGVDSGAASLNDRDDNHAKERAERQDANDGEAGPYPPWPVGLVRLQWRGLVGHRALLSHPMDHCAGRRRNEELGDRIAK